MRRVLAGLLLSAAFMAQAQEGYPLDGTWRGQRQGAPAAGSVIVMVIEWDGSKVTGVINPGPKALKITDVQLNPDGWKVSIAAESAAGQKATLEGVIENLGAYDRHISGKWTEGGRSYDVRIARE